MGLSVAVDYTAIRYLGVPNYCVTLAYWFLVPSYAALWLGGHWLKRNLTLNVRGAFLAVASLLVAVSVCFLISSGSFYWLGGRIAPSWDGWTRNIATWYWPFLKAPLIYVGVVAILYVIGFQLRREAPREASR